MKTVKRSKQKGRICSIHLPINCKSYLWFITGSGSAVSACDEESFLLASETVTGSNETTAGEDEEEEAAEAEAEADRFVEELTLLSSGILASSMSSDLMMRIESSPSSAVLEGLIRSIKMASLLLEGCLKRRKISMTPLWIRLEGKRSE